MDSGTFKINLVGDVMLGRLIDQLFPEHVHEPEEAKIAKSFIASHPDLGAYGPESPWGDVLPLLHSGDLNLINLETSVTTHTSKWPNKVFNYRMHPVNVTALTAAKVDYVTLSNNHTLDFAEPGLLETIRTVQGSDVAFAGAGESREETTAPAILRLRSRVRDAIHEIHIWAAADHPSDWSAVPNFHFIDYTQATRDRLKSLLNAPTSSQAALRIFSVHWGPNYAWQPSGNIREMAHYLVDECGIDVIHGHSSHHVQGVERYKGSLIIYGCGDFVDDYAKVAGYRNDLGGNWQVLVEETGAEAQRPGLKLSSLDFYPTKIDRFVAKRLDRHDVDSKWLCQKIKDLSAELGTVAILREGSEAGLTVNLA